MNKTRKRALVTGATSGIGHDIACIFAERGFDLFLVSRNAEILDEVKNDLEARHRVSVTTLPMDLSQAGAAQSVFETAQVQSLDISILVNNAGFGLGGALTDMEPQAVSEMIQLNCVTPTELCLLFGSEMKRKQSGHILNVASTAAYQPAPYIAAYGGTKSYLLNFTEALAKEMEEHGVVVTCLSPGPTDTHFFDQMGVDGLADKQTGIWAKKNRMPSRLVAEIGVAALFAGKLSVIAGRRNFWFAFGSRLTPRRLVAAVSKRIMKQAAAD